jgi:hypothetical protein
MKWMLVMFWLNPYMVATPNDQAGTGPTQMKYEGYTSLNKCIADGDKWLNRYATLGTQPGGIGGRSFKPVPRPTSIKPPVQTLYTWEKHTVEGSAYCDLMPN